MLIFVFSSFLFLHHHVPANEQLPPKMNKIKMISSHKFSIDNFSFHEQGSVRQENPVLKRDYFIFYKMSIISYYLTQKNSLAFQQQAILRFV